MCGLRTLEKETKNRSAVMSFCTHEEFEFEVEERVLSMLNYSTQRAELIIKELSYHMCAESYKLNFEVL